jgi:hypothetical protein
MARSRRRRSRRPAYLVYEDEFVISQAQAAETLGISVATLTAWRRRGKGPPFSMVGRYVRYSYADLIDFMASRTSDEEGR